MSDNLRAILELPDRIKNAIIQKHGRLRTESAIREKAVWRTIMMILGYICAVIGILSIVYGTIMAFGAHGTMFFMIWYVIGVLFIATGIIHIKAVHLPVVVMIIFRIFFTALFILFITVEGFIIAKFNEKAGTDVDYLIVAGAQVYADGPSRVLKFRLDTAAEYLKVHTCTICIVTGGKGSNEVRPEAEVMADYLMANGIGKSRILIENRSTTTTENMINAAAMYNSTDSSTAIVTNNFHLFRSMRIAKKQGINNICGIAAGSTPLYLPNNLLREFCGVCKDFLFGNM